MLSGEKVKEQRPTKVARSISSREIGNVFVISPLPDDGVSVGGVGPYSLALAESLAACHLGGVTIVAQMGGTGANESVGSAASAARVERTWPLGLRSLPALWRGLRGRDGIAHFQYEIALYGSPLVSLFFPLLLRKLRSSGTCCVVTMHHVVRPDFSVQELRLWKRPSIADRALLAIAKWIQRKIVSAADRVIVHEHRHAQALSAENVTVIPIGVTFTGRQIRKRRTYIPGSTLRVVFFGFLAPYKGVLELARGVEQAIGVGARVSLDIIGSEHPRMQSDKGYREFLSGLERISGRHPQVRMTGYLDDGAADKLLSEADIAILPYRSLIGSSAAASRIVGLGVPLAVSPALAESMEAGFSFRVEPAPESIQRLLAGIFDGTITLLNSGEERAASRASWEVVAAKHWECYRDTRSGLIEGYPNSSSS